MTKQRLIVAGPTEGRRAVAVETDATIGATLGVDLFYNGVVVPVERILNPEPGETEDTYVFWRAIVQVPPNVVALAETTTAGLYVVTGPGTSVTRQIDVGDQLAVENPDGIAGNPRITRTTIQHVEASPLATWTINHNLGRRVNAEVYTIGGVRMIAEILIASDNQVVVLFDDPVAGYAIIE